MTPFRNEQFIFDQLRVEWSQMALLKILLQNQSHVTADDSESKSNPTILQSRESARDISQRSIADYKRCAPSRKFTRKCLIMPLSRKAHRQCFPRPAMKIIRQKILSMGKRKKSISCFNIIVMITFKEWQRCSSLWATNYTCRLIQSFKVKFDFSDLTKLSGPQLVCIHKK